MLIDVHIHIKYESSIKNALIYMLIIHILTIKNKKTKFISIIIILWLTIIHRNSTEYISLCLIVAV